MKEQNNQGKPETASPVYRSFAIDSGTMQDYVNTWTFVALKEDQAYGVIPYLSPQSHPIS